MKKLILAFTLFLVASDSVNAIGPVLSDPTGQPAPYGGAFNSQFYWNVVIPTGMSDDEFWFWYWWFFGD